VGFLSHLRVLRTGTSEIRIYRMGPASGGIRLQGLSLIPLLPGGRHDEKWHLH
jgi:hypothetical protein